MPSRVSSLGDLSAFAYESITVAASAIGFTLATYKTTSTNAKTFAKRAFCTLESGQIRWRIDGSDPTSTVGHLLEIGQSLEIEETGNIDNFRAIATGGTNGALKVTYLR